MSFLVKMMGCTLKMKKYVREKYFRYEKNSFVSPGELKKWRWNGRASDIPRVLRNRRSVDTTVGKGFFPV